MSQANLAWQLMMGADDKIVIGTLNRDAWKSTELTQKEAQCVVRSSRYTDTIRRIDELCRCKSSNSIAESDTHHPKGRHSPYVAAKMISKARETVKMLVLETDQTDPNTMEESGSFGQIIDRLFTTAGNNHEPPLGIEVEMLFVVEDEVSPANFPKSARDKIAKARSRRTDTMVTSRRPHQSPQMSTPFSSRAACTTRTAPMHGSSSSNPSSQSYGKPDQTSNLQESVSATNYSPEPSEPPSSRNQARNGNSRTRKWTFHQLAKSSSKHTTTHSMCTKCIKIK